MINYYINLFHSNKKYNLFIIFPFLVIMGLLFAFYFMKASTFFGDNKGTSNLIKNENLQDEVTVFIEGSSLTSALYSDTLLISFKDQFDYFLDSGMVWKIKDENGSLMERGTGPISGIFFSKPGWYTIDLSQPLNLGAGLFSSDGLQINHDSCNHSPFPDILHVLVSESHLKFDFSSLKFSSPLSGGSVDGIIVTIKANYDHFYNKELDPKKLIILASGIGAFVKGELQMPTTVIQKGENILRYKLSGTFQKNTYIQLDFYDTNQQIQSYHHTSKLY
jgi:hypothetical protein